MGSKFAPPERIGFVGLGNMGAPMARRLAEAGFRLVVADAQPAAIERFANSVACERAPSLAEMGRTCRVVITMLPEGSVVKQVLIGEGGIASTLAKGSVAIDMSSSSPVGTRELATELAKREIQLVDAPVSGGVKKAADGTLAIMAGGDAATVERCQPILEVMGRVFTTGGSGSGHAMKALNNFLSAANLAVAAEAVIAGQRFGLDPELMIRILNASTGRNSATEQKFPANVLPRTFDSGFFLGLMAKDLRLALELARSTQSPTTLLEACTRMWSEAEKQLGFKADNTEVVRYIESLIPREGGGDA